MNYAEASKKVATAVKVKENFMLIEINYDRKLVLPHKAGVQFMAALESAEMLHEEYGEKARIDGMTRDAIIARTMSHKEYTQYKIAALLGLTQKEVAAMEKDAAENERTNNT